MTLERVQDLRWIYDLYLLGQSDLLKDDPAAVRRRLLEHIVDGFGANSGSLALRTDAGTLVLVAVIGLPPEAIGSTIEPGAGVMGWVIREGRSVLLAGDIGDDPRFCHLKKNRQGDTPGSSLCWPLTLENRVIGALSINRTADQMPFLREDLEHGSVLVNLVTVVVDNLQLHAERERQIQMLRQLNEKNREATRQLGVAHTQLLEADARLNGMLGSLDDAVWSAVPDMSQILYVSPAVEKISGYPTETFLNQSMFWLELVFPDDRNRVLAAFEEARERGTAVKDFRIVHSAGEIRWVHAQMRLAVDGDGKPLRIDGIATDITRHKLFEDELRNKHAELQAAYLQLQDLQGQLLQSEKMASIGQLAAGVAHEINNPIGYIYSNLGSLQGYFQDLFSLVETYEKAEPLLSEGEALAAIRAEKTRIDLDFIRDDLGSLIDESREGATRVKQIVQDLKDFSHVGADDQWQWADLRKGLDSTLNIVWNELKYKAEVTKDYGDTPEIECLPSQINQVFMNMLVNAAHAIEEKGVIRIRTGR
ncbi:MAG TPA: PAS domain-containing protein, partial [Methylococcaceae bacterium]|nr:PAS domain-containing protein [Methylococcaceae bacterium]